MQNTSKTYYKYRCKNLHSAQANVGSQCNSSLAWFMHIAAVTTEVNQRSTRFHDNVWYLPLPTTQCVILWAALLKKWWADFIETCCYDWAYQSEELIKFWWYLLWSRLPIPDQFSIFLTTVEQGILGDLFSISHSHLPISMKLFETTDADKVMNPQRFENDTADIWIQTWINPAIQIGILDNFWLKFWHWWRSVLSKLSLVSTIAKFNILSTEHWWTSVSWYRRQAVALTLCTIAGCCHLANLMTIPEQSPVYNECFMAAAITADNKQLASITTLLEILQSAHRPSDSR